MPSPRIRAPHAAIARPLLTVLAGSAVGVLGALASRVLFARLLTPTDVGVLVLGMGISSAVGGVATLGLSQAMAWRIAELRAAGMAEEARRSGGSGMLLGIASGIVAALATAAAAPAFESVFGADRLGEVVRLLTPVVVALPVGAAAVGIGRAWGDAGGRALIREAGGGLLRVGGVVVAAILFRDLRGVAAGLAVGTLLGEIAYALFVRAKGWSSNVMGRPWDFKLTHRLAPFWMMMVIVQVETWLEVLALGFFAPPAVVGLFGMARGLTRAVKLVEYAASHSFLPTGTALLRQGSAGAFLRLYVRTRTLVFALQWPALAVCLFAPNFVMSRVFGPAYGIGDTALCLLAAAATVSSLVSTGKDQVLVALGRAKYVVAVEGSAVAATGVALLFLAPSYGASGAAVATLVGAVVHAGLLSWLIFASSRAVPASRDVHPLPLSSVALCGATALVTATAGSFTGFIAVAACACLGSASCLLALWFDDAKPGSLFPRGTENPGSELPRTDAPGAPSEPEVGPLPFDP